MPNVGSVSVELQHIPRATLDVPPSELFTVAPLIADIAVMYSTLFVDFIVK
jgi:hypothetical protein